MLAPVVVKPETVSNIASVKLGISPLIQKGIHPTRLITIQLKDVAIQPSLR